MIPQRRRSALVDALAPDKLKARAHTAKQVYTSYTHTHTLLTLSLSYGALLPELHHYNNPALIATSEPKTLLGPHTNMLCRLSSAGYKMNHKSSLIHCWSYKIAGLFYTKKGQLVFWYCARCIPVVWFLSACDSFIWIPGSGDFKRQSEKGEFLRLSWLTPPTSAWLCNAVKWEMDSQRLMYFCLSGYIKPSALQEGDEPSLECKKKHPSPFPPITTICNVLSSPSLSRGQRFHCWWVQVTYRPDF